MMVEVRDLKYLLAYIIPFSALVSIQGSGWVTWLTVIIAFGVIPIMEILVGTDTKNLSLEEVEEKKTKNFFDLLLYLNIIFVYGCIVMLLYKLHQQSYEIWEIMGLIFSTGIVLGSSGINVAHELGHKSGKVPQLAARILLLPNLYMHFVIEHNYGHHKRVGTPEDPATSRYGEWVFPFWMRSIMGGYISALQIEISRLKKLEKPVWSLQNQIVQFLLLQGMYVALIGITSGLFSMFIILACALVGVLLLETINYIEHYGLVRKKLENGKYEQVENFHSWNSDHEIGRILLYELTRHADHHWKANKKYQILDHHTESPQLPYGYPTSILIALIPPLWFKLMNPLVDLWKKKSSMVVSQTV